MYYISTDADKFCVDNVKKLLHQTSWAQDWSEDKIKTAMEHSLLYGVFEKADDNQVAFARVITDYATTWYLCDVVVDENHRKNGVGKMLIDYITSDRRISNIPGMLITLDAHGLYEKYGFERSDGLYMGRKGTI